MLTYMTYVHVKCYDSTNKKKKKKKKYYTSVFLVTRPFCQYQNF